LANEFKQGALNQSVKDRLNLAFNG
jgi:hypothetical protein